MSITNDSESAVETVRKYYSTENLKRVKLLKLIKYKNKDLFLLITDSKIEISDFFGRCYLSFSCRDPIITAQTIESEGLKIIYATRHGIKIVGFQQEETKSIDFNGLISLEVNNNELICGNKYGNIKILNFDEEKENIYSRGMVNYYCNNILYKKINNKYRIIYSISPQVDGYGSDDDGTIPDNFDLFIDSSECNANAEIITNKTHIFKGHNNTITSIIVDNNNIITASCDHTMRVWNMDGESTVIPHFATKLKKCGDKIVSISYNNICFWENDNLLNLTKVMELNIPEFIITADVEYFDDIYKIIIFIKSKIKIFEVHDLIPTEICVIE